MNVIVAGGRDFTDSNKMLNVIMDMIDRNELPSEPTLICGMAQGADITAYFLFKGANCDVIEMPADWNTYGKSAGYRRNVEMSKLADKAICFWDGKSRGTKHMVDIMKAANKPVHVINY